MTDKEESLREVSSINPRSEEFYQQLVENCDDFIFLIDPQGKIQYFNPITAENLYFSLSEMEGKNIIDYLHPDDQPQIRFMLQNFVKKNPIHEVTVRLRKKNGIFLPVVVRAKLITNLNGSVSGLVITARRPSKLNEVPPKTNPFFNLNDASSIQWMLANIPGVIWTCDKDFQTIYISPPSFEILGFTTDEILSNSRFWNQQIHPDDLPSVKQEWGSLFEHSIPYEVEFRFEKKDGREIWLRDRSFSFFESEGKWFANGILVDITERKRFEMQLLQSQKMEALGRFAGGIAHDFNNLITVILGYGELLYTSKNTPEEVESFSHKILTTAQKAAQLTKKILLFSRSHITQKTPIDVNEIIMASQDLLQTMIGETIKLQFLLCSPSPIIVADKSKIEQILFNLAGNSRDAMEGAGILTIQTKTTIYSETFHNENIQIPPGDYCTIIVQDTGKGISPTAIPYIFEPFYSTKEIGHGTGLGLSIVYGILKQLGGYIYVTSQITKGTSFNIFIPIHHGKIARNSLKTSQLDISNLSKIHRVLLVEDNPSVYTFLSHVLMKEQCQIVQAKNGNEAYREFQANPDKFDLILTDIKMPGMDGKTLCKNILQLRPLQQILLISGFTDIDGIHELVQKPNVYFLAKPFKLAELSQIFKELIENREKK